MRNNVDLKTLSIAIKTVQPLLTRLVIPLVQVTAEELSQYFAGESPWGDTTDLKTVIDNQWLLIHELIELSELKRQELEISYKLLFTNPDKVLEAHITATEYELQLARELGDEKWIQQRIPIIRSWLDDPHMPQILVTRCHEMINTYSRKNQ